jgi:aminodeoxychorismate lyase
MSGWLCLARDGDAGQLLPADAPAVPATDRGLLYGDGLFETIRVYGGHTPLWERHMARLRSSAHRINLNLPWSDAALLAGCRAALAASELHSGALRLTVTRGTGPRGYAPPPDAKPTAIAQPSAWSPPLAAYRRGWRLQLAATVVWPGAVTWQVKSLSALEKTLARGEAAAAHADEALLRNADGCLAEGAASNLFWARGGELYTPALSCGVLPGIARGLVLELAGAGGIPCHEGCYSLTDLSGADEVFMTNALVQLMPVSEVIGLRTWPPGPGPLAARLMAEYTAYVARSHPPDPGTAASGIGQ